MGPKQGLCPLDLMKIHGNLVNVSGVEVKNRNSYCLLRETKGSELTAKKVKAVLVCLCCWCVCVAGVFVLLVL